VTDNQFRAAVFQRFMEGSRDSSAKEIAQVSGCHEAHVYAYLRSQNQFAPDGVTKCDSYRGNRKVHVFRIDDAILREIISELMLQHEGAYNLFFDQFQERMWGDNVRA
jgi:hypothetical protein